MGEIKKAAIAAIFISVAVLAGCGSTETGRQEINTGNKKITILETAAPVKTEINSKSNEFEIEKIEKYEGVLGEGWLDENSILTAKKTSETENEKTNGKMKNLWNLYSYDLKLRKETIIDKLQFMGLMDKPVLSPDGKHLFSQSFQNGKISALIFDLDGNILAETKSDGLLFQKWADNEEVMLTAPNNGVCFININSKVTRIENFGLIQTEEAFELNDKIYYVSTDRKLVAYDINTKQRKTVKDNVLNFTLSPKKDLLAIEKAADEGNEALILMDPEGNEKTTIAKAKMFFGVSWSPDQSKLVYAITSYEKSKEGLYVTELSSKKILYTSPDFVGIGNDPVWSPSGKKILTNIQDVKDMKGIDNAYIISLK